VVADARDVAAAEAAKKIRRFMDRDSDGSGCGDRVSLGFRRSTFILSTDSDDISGRARLGR
jgi:hypothetical protein